MTWETVPLGEVVRVDAVHVQPGNVEAGSTYVGLEHISAGGVVDETSLAADAGLKSNKNRFTNRHILYGKLRPNLGKVARPRTVGVCSTDIYPLLPGSEVDRDYLAQFLLSPQAIGYASSRTAGVNLPRVSWSALSSLPIPLPPLTEQRRIAAILDEADTLHRTRSRSMALLASQSAGLFDSLFDASLGITEHHLLGDRLDFLTSGSRGWATYYSESGAKFLRIQNVRAGRVQLDDIAYVAPPDTAEARRTRVMEGDVILSITADLGRTAVIPASFGGAHINQHLAILRAPSINPVYLAGYLESRTGSRQLLGMDRGQTKAGLNFDNIRSLRVPLPELAQQNHYAERKAAIEQEMTGHQSHLRSLDALFASLQHRAFRGEL